MLDKSNFINIFSSRDEVTGQIIERKIIIPIIQRDYAQGRTDERASRVREKFLQELYRAVTGTPITLDFIYGDIDKETNVITLLDGQQRITTLFLLYWYAAKKAELEKTKYDFLKRFSYETRYSSRLFCKDLIDYTPDFSKVPSDDIEDQPWFTLGWKNDPTIKSMLVMLDAINEKFSDVPDLWEKLANNAITFYFLPIEKMGLTDELYIKMNSRGKPLSEFENFKAELEGEISKYDKNKATDIIKKIDGIWTDLLWSYKDNANTIDTPFLNFFRIICQIIAYKEGQSFEKNYGDSFNLMNEFFNADSPEFENHIEFLEQFFDSWYKVKEEGPLDAFFDKYLSVEHVASKVKINQHEINIFKDCASSDNYPLPKLILFYAFIIFIENQDSIPEDDFRRRLRVINNLILNSNEEITDRENRDSGNRMPTILRQTECIIKEGLISADIGLSFNANQLEEENEKLDFTANNPELAEKLFALEDHDLLTGQMSVIGLENHDIFERFEKLFNCDYDKVNRALVATGDYSQKIGRYGIYQFGTSANTDSWRNLFHKSARNFFFERTKGTICTLLKRYDDFSDELLDSISKEYLDKCEQINHLDWRYYFIKYNSFRPNPKQERFYGKYYSIASDSSDGETHLDFDVLIMPTRTKLSESAYSPFLKEVCKCVDGNLAGTNLINKLYLKEANCYYSFSQKSIKKLSANEDENGLLYFTCIGETEISQNEDGSDAENRIEKLINIIRNETSMQVISDSEASFYQNPNAWKDDVLSVIKQIPKEEFELEDTYLFKDQLSEMHPFNNNIEAKIRQQLQVLRDEGMIEFLGNGTYKKLF